MGKKSREKGKRGEREAAAEVYRILGVKARRGRQFSGSPESPDIVSDIKGVHFEVKRTESLSLYAAMEQAATDAAGKVPAVLHKRSRKDWLLVIRLEDLPLLIAELSR